MRNSATVVGQTATRTKLGHLPPHPLSPTSNDLQREENPCLSGYKVTFASEVTPTPRHTTQPKMAAAVQMSRNVACLIATLALAGRKAAVAEQVVGGEADFQFVNVARHGIRLGPLPGKTAQPAVDELGWPMEDCQVVVFDDRPAFAWAPPMDDPQALQGDYSGLWRVRVVGNATLALGQASGITLVNQVSGPRTPLCSTLPSLLPRCTGA